jgi:hypothetical protein
MFLQRFLSLTAFAIMMMTAASAQTSTGDKPYYYIPDVPDQIEKVDFYLLTVGIGDEIAARYGHTGIRVVNHIDKTDVVFNWGKFQFDDPMFAVNFYRGDLTYSMGVRTFRGDVEHHREDSRRMVQEKINLNSKQKRKLLEKIAWNSRPENRDFKYQYWFKNCSTIPRDYINDVTEGQVRDQYYGVGAGKTFRDYVRSNLSLTPGLIPVLDTIMNSRIDREMTKWEEMFLPGKLREHLLGMNAIDVDGNPVIGVPLLSETKLIMDYPENVRDYHIDYAVLSGGLWSVAGLMGIFLYRRRRNPENKTLFRMMGCVLLVLGTVSGFFGIVMTLNWMFSGHPDIWHNANLMLFTPFDVLFIPIGYRMWKTSAPVKDRWPFLRAGEVLAWVHVSLFLVSAFGRAAGLVSQNVNMVLLAIGLPVTVLVLIFVRHGIQRFVPDFETSPAVREVLTPAGVKRRRKHRSEQAAKSRVRS